MSGRKPDLFRARALEHISTPEQLDQLLRVTRRRYWIPLFVIAGFGVLIGIWSVKGRIPVTVAGEGILIVPSQIVSLQTPAGGQVVDLLIDGEARVAVGDVIAVIAQPDLRRELEQEQNRLAELRLREEELGPLRRLRLEREIASIENRRALCLEMVDFLRETGEELKTRSDIFFAEQRRSSEELGKKLDELGRKLAERRTLAEQFRDRAITGEEILSLEKELVAHEASRAEMAIDSQQVSLDEIRSANAYRQMLVEVRELQATLEELRAEEERVRFRFEEETAAARVAIREVELRSARLSSLIDERSQVRSSYAGRVLEVSISEGQVLGEGQRIATLETSEVDTALEALCFYDLRDGKRIGPGDPIRITPSTVERERYGSIRGEVVEVSTMPLTPAAIERRLGNAELARRLSGGGSRLQVRARMLVDSGSGGYLWTSGKGPDLHITPGTTLVAHARVEERTPLSLVLPILRELGGE